MEEVKGSSPLWSTRQLVKVAQIVYTVFKLIYFIYHRGIEQLAARQAHNLEVVGSSPTPATNPG